MFAAKKKDFSFIFFNKNVYKVNLKTIFLKTNFDMIFFLYLKLMCLLKEIIKLNVKTNNFLASNVISLFGVLTKWEMQYLLLRSGNFNSNLELGFAWIRQIYPNMYKYILYSIHCNVFGYYSIFIIIILLQNLIL